MHEQCIHDFSSTCFEYIKWIQKCRISRGDYLLSINAVYILKRTKKQIFLLNEHRSKGLQKVINANQILCTTRIRDINRFNWPRRLLYMALKAYKRFTIYCGQLRRGKSAMSKKSSICIENAGDVAVSREFFVGIFESAFSVYKTLI